MQRDAFERLDLKSMLLQPEMLEAVQPDVHLVATLMALRGMIPAKTRDTARAVVGGWSPRSWRSWKSRCARPSAARSTAPSATAARVTPRSTGTAPSAPTCATGRPTTRPSSPSS
jgi:hypothetical protein